MSQVIDKKIVDMEFNNSRFESNVHQTIGTLDKLKQSLNFKGLEKSFDNIEESSKHIKMGNLAESVGKVHEKFSALEVMAVGALMNIGSQAVDAGTKLVKSLSIDQVSAGWSKYAEKTKAVQTIMAATRKEFTDEGEQMEYVNGQLDKLNWFTDETSYSFLDMVNSIGKFTSNAVKLDTAVTAMQGISTWAAISGAGVTEAGRAMYNLSQALATGSVKLIDWKSIENANMATAEFKENVIQIAEEMGYLKRITKDTFETTGKSGGDRGLEVSVSNFNEALADGKWFTNNVLLKALDRYGKFSDKLYEVSEATGLTATELLQDLDRFKKGTLDISMVAKSTGVSAEFLSEQFETLGSKSFELGRRAFQAAQEAKTFQEAIDATKDAVSTGWMNTFEIIFGSYDKAKELWTDVANNLWDLFASGGEERNALLRTALYKDEWDEFASTITKTNKTWNDFSVSNKKLAQSFDLTIDQLAALEKRSKKTGEPIEDLIESFGRLSGRELLVKSLQNVFDALFRAIEVVKEAWHDIFPKTTADQLYNFIEKIEKFTSNLYLTDERAEKVKHTLKGLFAILDAGKYIISTIISGIKRFIGEIVDADSIFSLGEKIGDTLLRIRDTIKESGKVEAVINKIVDILIKVVNYIKDAINGTTKLGQIIRKVIAFIKEVIAFIKETVKGNNTLGKSISKVIGFIKEVIARFKDFSKEAFQKVKVPKNSFIGVLETIFLTIIEVSKKIVGVVSKIVPRIKKVFQVIWNVIKDIGARIGKAFSGSGFTGVLDLINSGILVGIMTKLFGFFSSLKKTGKNLSGIADTIKEIFNGVSDSLAALQKNIQSKTIKNIAIALGILAASLFVISTIDTDKLFVALTALSAMLWELVGVMEVLKKMNAPGPRESIFQKIFNPKSKNKTSTTPLIALSAAVLVLSFAMKNFAELSWEGVEKGIVSISALLAILLAYIAITNSAGMSKKGLKQSTSGLITLSIGILILSKAMEAFGNMEWKDIIKGITSIGVLLGLIAAYTKLSGKSISGAISLSIVASSLLVLFLALKLFSKFSWDEMAHGFAAIGGMLISLAAGLNAMKKTISGAVALTIASGALLILYAAFKLFSKLEYDAIIKSFVGIGGSLAILAIGLALMKKSISGAVALTIATVALLGLYLALMLFGSLETDQIVKGLLAIAGVIAIIGISAAALSSIVPAMLGLSAAMVLFGAGLIAIGLGLAALGLGISAVVSAVRTAIDVILLSVDKIVSLIPHLVMIVGDFIVELVKYLKDEIPFFVSAIFEMIIEVLKTLTEKTPEIVKYLFDFLIEVINALALKVPELIKSLVNLMMSVFQGVVDALSTIDPEVFIKGLLGIGLLTSILVLLAAMAILAPAAMIGVVALGFVIAELLLVLTALSELYKIDGIFDIIENGGSVLAAIGNAIGKFIGAIVGGFAESMSESLPVIADNLSDFMVRLEPFIDGVKQLDSDFLSKALMLPAILLAILATEVIDGITSWLFGKDAIGTFCDDIVRVGAAIKQFSDEVNGIDAVAVQSAANAAEALNSFAKHAPKYGGIVSWFEGETNLVDFAVGIISVGIAIKDFYQQVRTVNPKVVTLSACAAQALNEFASNVPKHGGLVSLIKGDNSLVDFSEGLIEIGKAMHKYYDEVKYINPRIVIFSSAAANSIAEFAKNIPPTGGWLTIFKGDDSLLGFAKQLPAFGEAMSKYSKSITENGSINTYAIKKSTEAADAIANVASSIKENGLGDTSFWTGKTQFETFGESLESFAKGISEYSKLVSGENFIDLPGIINSATGAKKIADVAKVIMDNDLGKSDFWTGKTQFETFGESLTGFAECLSEYSNTIKSGEIDNEAIVSSAASASSIADVFKIIADNHLGDKNVLGGNKIDGFSEALIPLGNGITGFCNSLKDIYINPAAVAYSTLTIRKIMEIFSENDSLGKINILNGFRTKESTFSSLLPKIAEGISGFCNGLKDIYINPAAVAYSTLTIQKVMDIFSENDALGKINILNGFRTKESTFSSVLPKIAEGISGFCNGLKDIYVNPVVTSYAILVAKQIAGIYEYVPKLGGIAKLISGDEDLSKFAYSLQSLATGVFTYCSGIEAMAYEPEKVASSIRWLKDLAGLYEYVPKFKGIAALFSGDEDLSTFAGSLSSLAKALVAYAIEVMRISWDADKIGQSVTTAKSLSEVLNDLSGFTGSKKVKSFGDTLMSFGDNLIAYKNKVASLISNVGYDPIHKSIADARAILALFDDLKALDGTCADNFLTALSNLGNSSITEFTKAFTDGHSSIKTSAEGLVKVAENAISDKVSKMYDAGKAAAKGFSNGLSSASSQALAANAGKIIGQVALDALKKALKINSPSKEFEYAGEYCPEGFYNGAIKGLKYSRMAGEKIGKEALSSTSKALSQISEILDTNINTDPVIRPVIDLDGIRKGSLEIDSMFSSNRALSISARMANNDGQAPFGSRSMSPVTQMTFNQYNNSPKALTPIEIYRQTKNQFASLQRRTSTYYDPSTRSD